MSSGAAGPVPAPAASPAPRALPPAPPHRLRRDGLRVVRRGPAAGPHGRDQDPRRALRPRSPRGSPLQARGSCSGARLRARPRGHGVRRRRHRARGERSRRRARLHRHGVPRRRHRGRRDPGGRRPPPRGAALAGRGRLGPGPRPRSRDRAPRHQAGQLPARSRPGAARRRLRDRAAGLRGHDHLVRPAVRHRRLSGARAGAGPSRVQRLGSLCAGGGRLRAAGRRAAVHRHALRRPGAPARRGRAAERQRAQPQPPAGRRRDPPAWNGQGARCSVRERRRAGGRCGACTQRGADEHHPADEHPRAVAAGRPGAGPRAAQARRGPVRRRVAPGARVAGRLAPWPGRAARLPDGGDLRRGAPARRARYRAGGAAGRGPGRRRRRAGRQWKRLGPSRHVHAGARQAHGCQHRAPPSCRCQAHGVGDDQHAGSDVVHRSQLDRCADSRPAAGHRAPADAQWRLSDGDRDAAPGGLLLGPGQPHLRLRAV